MESSLKAELIEVGSRNAEGGNIEGGEMGRWEREKVAKGREHSAEGYGLRTESGRWKAENIRTWHWAFGARRKAS